MALSICNLGISLGDIQRNYLFYVKFLTIPGMLSKKRNDEWKTSIDNMPTATKDILNKIKEGYERNDTFINTAALGADVLCLKAPWPSRKSGLKRLNWAGEYLNFTGVDETNKEGDMVYLMDQNGGAGYFWSLLADLTGELMQHASYGRWWSTFDLAVAMVHVNKLALTEMAVLHNCQCVGYELQGDLDKEGSDFLRCKSTLIWDFHSFPSRGTPYWNLVESAVSQLPATLLSAYGITDVGDTNYPYFGSYTANGYGGSKSQAYPVEGDPTAYPWVAADTQTLDENKKPITGT